MIVRQTKKALSDSGSATLSQLAAELGASRPVVAAALDFWVKRGQVRIRRIAEAPEFAVAGCSPVSCSGCPLVPLCTTRAGSADGAMPIAIYEWNGGEADGS